MTKRLTISVLLLLTIALPLHADFDAVARAIDAKQGVSRVWIPFLGVARFAVWLVAPRGVQDFQLVTFRGAEKLDARELQNIVRSEIGAGFTPLVQVWSRKSREWSFIYAKPAADGKHIELVVLAHDNDDTVLVRVATDADAIAREINRHPRNVTNVARR